MWAGVESVQPSVSEQSPRNLFMFKYPETPNPDFLGFFVGASFYGWPSQFSVFLPSS